MVLTFPNLPNGYFRYLGPEKPNGKVAYASTIFLMSELIYETEHISKNPYSTIKLLHKTIPSVFPPFNEKITKQKALMLVFNIKKNETFCTAENNQ